jgi:hypothetical protein
MTAFLRLEGGMSQSVVRASLFALAVVSVSCSDARMPTAPRSVATEPVTSGPAPAPPAEPSGTTGTRIFGFASSQLPVSQSTAGSRYVLHPDGAFVLEYPDFVYRGRYREANGRLIFEWDTWGALGVLAGDTLAVSHDLVARLDGFEDAIYRRVPTPAPTQGIGVPGGESRSPAGTKATDPD